MSDEQQTNQPTQPSQGQDVQGESLDTLLASITNPEGEQKYADVPTALKSVAHSEETISSLRAELESLKQEVAKSRSVDEVAEQLRSQKAGKEKPSQSLSVDDIDSYLESKLKEREDAAQRQQREASEKANLDSVVNQLKKSFGDKAADMFESVAKDLDMSAKELVELAKSKPKAVLKQFSVSGKAVSNGAPTSTANTSNLNKGLPELKPVGYGTMKDMKASYQAHVDYINAQRSQRN